MAERPSGYFNHLRNAQLGAVNCVTCASKVWRQHVAHDHRKRQYDSRRHVAVATTPNLRLLVVIGRTYGNRQLHIEIGFLSVLTFSRSTLSACLCVLAQTFQLLAPFDSPAVSVSQPRRRRLQAQKQRWAFSWLLLRLRAILSTPAVCWILSVNCRHSQFKLS